MTDQQKLNEIISLMTFIQKHIQNYVNQSFTDLTFNLETVIKDFLNVFEKDTEKYENINTMQHNYPAIDLVNKTKDTAIQVTTNADLRKVKKTVTTYQEHRISYSSLIVIGFVKATKSSLPNVTVHSIDYLIELAKYGTSEQKDKVYEILQRQIPLNSLNPLADKLCFDVVFDVLNRSAIRDYTKCEGNFDNMVFGLYEVKEIITTGKIKGKSIRAKALVEYTDRVKRHLSEIEFHVSEILQICNLNKERRNSSYLDLTRQDTERIDDLKEKIITKTNALADKMQLNKKIMGSKRC
jgi:hypothetical protein